MSYQTSCANCSLAPICLPLGVDPANLETLDGIILRGRPMHAGDHLFRVGDPFEAIYAVRSGAVKTYTLSADGEERVTGFHLPGEMLGVDGISTSQHVSSAVALETTSICEIPFDRLGDLAQRMPDLQSYFFRLLSKQIVEDQHLAYLLSRKTAEERMASLLWSLSARHARRRLSATAYRLAMSRQDIGSYLGLAVETVSRVLKRFQEQGMIEVKQREVTIRDLAVLEKMAGVDPCAEASCPAGAA